MAVPAMLLLHFFILVRVRENSMAPTLFDGQWVLVLRGSHWVRNGDVAVFKSPIDGSLLIKRCVLIGDEDPLVQHGWLTTPWGNWFFNGMEWDRLMHGPKPLEDAIFVVGDNQFHSTDSRSYGYIRREDFIGRVLIRRNRDE